MRRFVDCCCRRRAWEEDDYTEDRPGGMLSPLHGSRFLTVQGVMAEGLRAMQAVEAKHAAEVRALKDSHHTAVEKLRARHMASMESLKGEVRSMVRRLTDELEETQARRLNEAEELRAALATARRREAAWAEAFKKQKMGLPPVLLGPTSASSEAYPRSSYGGGCGGGGIGGRYSYGGGGGDRDSAAQLLDRLSAVSARESRSSTSQRPSTASQRPSLSSVSRLSSADGGSGGGSGGGAAAAVDPWAQPAPTVGELSTKFSGLVSGGDHSHPTQLPLALPPLPAPAAAASSAAASAAATSAAASFAAPAAAAAALPGKSSPAPVLLRSPLALGSGEFPNEDESPPLELGEGGSSVAAEGAPSGAGEGAPPPPGDSRDLWDMMSLDIDDGTTSVVEPEAASSDAGVGAGESREGHEGGEVDDGDNGDDGDDDAFDEARLSVPGGAAAGHAELRGSASALLRDSSGLRGSADPRSSVDRMAEWEHDMDKLIVTRL